MTAHIIYKHECIPVLINRDCILEGRCCHTQRWADSELPVKVLSQGGPVTLPVSDSNCRDHWSLCMLPAHGSGQPLGWTRRTFQTQHAVIIRALTTILCFQLFNERLWFSLRLGYSGTHIGFCLAAASVKASTVKYMEVLEGRLRR